VSELDVLRGFAMLGVYIVNFVEMNALPPGEVGIYPEFHRALDGAVEWLYREFFNEKFCLIFVFSGYFQQLSMSMLFALAVATYLLASLLCLLMQQRLRSGVLELLMKRLTYG